MIRELLFILFLIHSAQAQNGPVNPEPAVPVQPGAGHAATPAPVNAGPKKTWLTLKGAEPIVIARGGFSGLYPDSSDPAYALAHDASLPGSILYCDLQLTKDNLGVCQTAFPLDLSTNLAAVFPKGKQTYNVNGKDVTGWFSLDYLLEELQKDVKLNQNVFSRTSAFDQQFGLLAPEQLADMKDHPAMWLNVQYDMFYVQRKLSVLRYLEDSTQYFVPGYISSPEIDFLKAVGASKMDKTKTKLIFVFLNKDMVEPTTKETYGSLLTKLSTIKTFAAGILVPKDYIWPLSKDLYLESPTTLVADAHKEGLEVYASGFMNDFMSSYNYSYDPTAEYVQFVDNSQFSVDGVMTDFPATASGAISCLAHNQNATTKVSQGLIISHDGASGDYPGCTDIAYENAIKDGADIIDCAVQMSKDGTAFCLGSVDLSGRTNAATVLMDKSVSIPEIQSKEGIFSFDLTWSEIQALKPQILNPFMDEHLYRNPRFKNSGKFVTLNEFLELAKKNAAVGVMISIQHAAYLASKKGLDVVETVTSALSKATLDKQKVLIQSDDSSVLAKFKDVPAYERVFIVKDGISGVSKVVAEEIKKHADSVNVGRSGVIASNSEYFATNFTNVVAEMRAANVSVYVSDVRNEFASQVFDFFADPYVEFATYFQGLEVKGVITDNPKSASAYLKSPCSDSKATLPYTFFSTQPGSLLELVDPSVMPPTAAPLPALETSDVVDPPLPAVAHTPADDSTSTSSSTAADSPKSAAQPKFAANATLSILAILLLSLYFN